MKKITLSILILAAIMHYVSCSKDSTSATSTTVDCTGVSAKFAADVQPIFKAKCGSSGCHPAKDMETYSTLKPHVDEGHIKLYIVDRATPPSGMTTAGGCTTAESKIVACWIQAGAANN